MKTIWVCKGCGKTFELEADARGTPCAGDVVEAVEPRRRVRAPVWVPAVIGQQGEIR